MSEHAYSYVVKVGDRTYNVLVRPAGENRFRVVVEGEELEVFVETGRPSVAARPEPAKPVEAKASPGGSGHSSESADKRPEAMPRAAPAPASVPSAAPTAPAAAPAVSGAVIASPIPGKVLKVLVNPGDLVSPGKLVATLESMKMEVEVFSDKNGRVRDVRARPGDFVNVGDPLVVLE